MRNFIFLLSALTAIAFASVNIDKLKQEGKDGNKDALFQLGFIYENGNGVEADKDLALRYYRQAIELGSEDAKLALALLELDKKINKKKVSLSNSVKIKTVTGLNYQLSVDDLKETLKLAKKGDKEALFTLATLYDSGYGTIKADKKRALALYIKAAKLGSKKAKDRLLYFKESKK